MPIASHPFASNPNGATEVTSADAAAEQQRLQEAINKVLLEHYGFTVGARTDLTCFSFLFDQVVEQTPGQHPLDVARALYVRLHSSANEWAVSEAFSMGSLIATAFRNRPANYQPATVKDDDKIDFNVPTGDPVVDNYIRQSKQT